MGVVTAAVPRSGWPAFASRLVRATAVPALVARIDIVNAITCSTLAVAAPHIDMFANVVRSIRTV